jgi:hypothetical protein
MRHLQREAGGSCRLLGDLRDDILHVAGVVDDHTMGRRQNRIK